MPVKFNLRHLEEKSLSLKDELPIEELAVGELDELIKVKEPLCYDLEVERLEQGILARGSLVLKLLCECARCLKPYEHTLSLEDWVCHLPLEGEDKAEVINDCVDLTPYIREDIVLAFPQHPLCGPECKGLKSPKDWEQDPGGDSKSSSTSAAWAELNKLKLK